MVDALEEVQYQPGETIIKEDEEGTHFYMIVEGDVSVTPPRPRVFHLLFCLVCHMLYFLPLVSRVFSFLSR